MKTLLEEIQTAAKVVEFLDASFEIVNADWTPAPEEIVAIQSNLIVLSRALDHAENLVLGEEEETAKTIKRAEDATAKKIIDVVIRILAQDKVLATGISNYESLPIETQRRLEMDL